METSFIQLQLGLFFKSDFQGQFENVSLFIKEQFGNDVTVQIIGIPPNAPSEIPRVFVNSNLVNINVTKNRIDFFSKNILFIEENFEKIFNLINNLSVNIGRVGIVTTSFVEISIDDFKKIFDQAKISTLNPKEITVRFNEEIDLNGFKVNNSQMYTTGFVNDETGTPKTGVVITRDINSLIEDINKNLFTKEKLHTFISGATTMSKNSLI